MTRAEGGRRTGGWQADRQADWQAALLDPTRPAPAGLRAWNGSDPAARLAVHRNNVIGGLVDGLAANYPVVQQLVGEDFFRAMAAAYVRQSPPRCRVLANYGDDLVEPDRSFAGFIAQFRPADPVPYLADMARLECARTRACHAADALPLTAEAGAAAMAHGERIGELRLVCHPSMNLVVARHAVASIWAAHQTDREVMLDTIDPTLPEAALVLRPRLDVLVVPLPAGWASGMAAFLSALQQQAGLADAAEQALAAQHDFDLAANLSLLVAQGALSAIHLPESLRP